MLKVGDKFKVVRIRSDAKMKAKHLGDIFTVRCINPNGWDIQKDAYGVVEDCNYIFYDDEVELVEESTNIKDVIFNNPATIILWKDGTKTVVKCQKGDKYDKEKGFVMCYLKKLLGNDNTFNKEIGKWVSYEEDEVEQIVTNKVPKEITFTVKVHSEDE